MTKFARIPMRLNKISDWALNKSGTHAWTNVQINELAPSSRPEVELIKNE